jgi:hypothetical protein
VGIGAGSFIRYFHHHFPSCLIDAVDCSPQVIAAARGYFHLPEEDSRLLVYCRDGREFLEQEQGRCYDLILIDAFDDSGTSYQLMRLVEGREQLGESDTGGARIEREPGDRVVAIAQGCLYEVPSLRNAA